MVSCTRVQRGLVRDTVSDFTVCVSVRVPEVHHTQHAVYTLSLTVDTYFVHAGLCAHLREPYLTLDFVAFSCCRDWRLGLLALAAAVALGAAAASKKASDRRPL